MKKKITSVKEIWDYHGMQNANLFLRNQDLLVPWLAEKNLWNTMIAFTGASKEILYWVIF